MVKREHTLETLITSSQRKLLVSEEEVLLDVNAANRIFVLIIEEAAGAAGGRAAGSGSRRIGRVYGFNCAGSKCEEFFQSSDPEMVDKFEIPYSAVAMDIKLSDGRPFVVQGVVDPDLVKSYMITSGKLE